MATQESESKSLNVIVGRSLNDAVQQANELGVTDKEYLDTKQLPHGCYAIIYYR